MNDLLLMAVLHSRNDLPKLRSRFFFLHPPMQALKQAAREGDAARLDVVCEEWQVAPAAAASEAEEAPQAPGEPAPVEPAPKETASETEPHLSEPHVEARR